MNEILMQAVVECAALLSLTSDSELNPDLALKELEQLISMLRALEENDFRKLIGYIKD